MTPFGESTGPGQRRSAVPSASCPAEIAEPWWVIFGGMMEMFEAEFWSKNLQKKQDSMTFFFFKLYIYIYIYGFVWK